jgi:MOSC domain-containing protein YiiM
MAHPVAERVLSVNVGQPTQVPYRGGLVSTSIFKAPVDGPVTLRRLGFDGDSQADPTVHGGEHKAAYFYSTDAYAWWSGELGHELQPGEFGENLTVTRLLDTDVSTGDVLRVGTATVEVTTPREPCFKLGIRMGDPRFVPRFRDANRTGFYVRVLDEGAVEAGDAVEVMHRAPGSVTIAEFHRIYVDGRSDVDALRRLAAVPNLEPGWLEWCERRIAEASSA